MAMFKFLLHQQDEDSLKLHYTFIQPGGSKRTTVLSVVSTELCIKGAISIT